VSFDTSAGAGAYTTEIADTYLEQIIQKCSS